MAKTAKKVAEKPATKSAPAKVKSFKEPLTKTQLLQKIAEQSGVAKKDVVAVLENLSEIIGGHIKPKAAGKLNLLGLFSIEVRNKPATKARKGISPFTGEEIMFKAKPARKVVKIKALKKLKEMADK